jgi:flagellar biosynthesis/type III secretory pathway protein FliH
MPAIWCWLDVETILSDLVTTTGWSAHPLLSRSAYPALFQRNGWDEAQAEAFGPWRLGSKLDPISGQLLAMDETPESAPEQATEPQTAEPLEPSEPAEEAQRTGFSEEQVAVLLEQARSQGWQTGRDAAVQELTADLEAQRQTLQATAAALHALQSDSQRLLEPLKKLSLHVAQELVRGELQLGSAVIERLIQVCIEALDQPAQTTVIQVGHADMHRLRDLNLPGIALELDESLSEGSVRAKVADTQVQDLIEHRLSQMARQILQGDA